MTQLKRKDKDDSETSHFNFKEIIREPNVSVHGACQSAAYYATLNRASRLGGCGCFVPFFHFMAVLFSPCTSIILDIQVTEVNWRCTKGPASCCMRAPAFEVLFIYLHINSYPAWLCF